MEVDAVLTAIQTRLKAEMSTECGGRVFIVPSIVSVPQSYNFPYIAIIYKGGVPDSNMYGGINYHDIDIMIFQDIRAEESVVIGTTADSGQNMGLTKLLSNVETALKNYELPVPVPAGDSTPITIMSYSGTQDWITNGEGYSASIGLTIKVGVSYGI